MRNYIREHLKGFIGITVLSIFTIALIGSTELIAKMLPDATELTGVVCKSKEGEVYEYTGEEIKPEFCKILFKDQEGNTVKVEEGDFAVLSYTDNIDFGFADIEVALEGYRNSVVVEDAFEIVIGQVDGFSISESTKEAVTFTWEMVPGSDGYILYKSSDNGNNYAEVQRVYGTYGLTCKDAELAANETYLYKVAAYRNTENGEEAGKASDVVKHITPLDDPVASAADKVDHQSIKVTWEAVPGAVGYQVFRSTDETGTFELIGEVADQTVTNYTDNTCELGITYFYHVVACQQIDETIILGNPSNVVSGSTTPNAVSIKGSMNEDKTSATLTWKAVEKADGYEIYRGSKLLKTVDANTTSYIDTDLTDSEAYTYKVRAYAEVNGQKVYGSFSGEYTKIAKVNYQYTGSGTGSLAGVTSYVGTSYVPGGYTPSGWDCSGFTQWALMNYFGASIPKAAASQGAGGTSISVGDRSQWQAGDILCYANSSGRISHVALYLGNGQLMHALNSKYNTFVQGVDYYETWDSGNTLAKVKRYH